MAAAGDDPSQREHRRVGGENGELAARGRQREAAVERPLERRHDLDPRRGRARRRRTAARAPLRGCRWRRAARGRATSGSKSTSQIHETSRPSAMSSLSATTATCGDAPSTRVRTASFAPAGFFTSSIRRRRSPIAIRSKRPNAAEKRPRPRADVCRRDTECEAERRGRECVVDVVEPRQAQLDPRFAGRGSQREGGSVEAAQLDLARRHVERRSGVAAVRAAVVAEMADVGGRVHVRRPAAEAVLRVGRVLERGSRLRGVVDPERERPRAVAAEVADLRVVAVDDERRLRQRGDRLAPAGGDELELAVAVELVAEEVREEQRLRTDATRDLGQRALVDLEQPELGVARLEQRRGDAGDEVRPGAVVRDAGERREQLGGHRRGRRLPVRRRDEHRPLRAGAGRAGRSRSGRASTGASRAGSCRPPGRRDARASLPRGARRAELGRALQGR